MAFFSRLLAGRGSDPYQTGLALFEQGRAAEAIPLLRAAFQQDPSSPRGSLAGLCLRQALTQEARSMLQAGQSEAAAALLGEAAATWPEFADLQFQAGAAHALAGRWDVALDAARQALRRNPDYCEARLLEACALHGLARLREARGSLLALLESGRRVAHGLVHILEDALAGLPEDVFPDLGDHLRRTFLGDDAKRCLAEAVALCRAGRWQDGLASLAELSRRYPRYPDVRARHAAALYQDSRLAEALAEVEAALQVNPRYRTAVGLKGLILADQGELQAAQDFLAEAVPRVQGTIGRHEELFLAYLRAVLALLLGDLAGCRGHLEGWQDLSRQFARAALLLAACDDLSGLPDAALRRLEELCPVWSGDAELYFLRAALLMRQKHLAAVESLLAQWPAGAKGFADQRPLLLRARLSLLQGREPLLPQERPPEGVAAAAGSAETEPIAIARAAWRQLAVSALLMRGQGQEAWQEATDLLAGGLVDEETGRLVVQAAAATSRRPPADLAARVGPADSWIAELCRLLRRQHAGVQAEQLIQSRLGVRPDHVQWSWLSAGFWLAPVRRWLG